MKTNRKTVENSQERPRHNVALGIYTILTTAFVAGYTLIQVFAL
jgi:hypothetical protein